MYTNNYCRQTCWCYCCCCQSHRLLIYVSKHPDVLLQEIDAATQRENNAVDKAFEDVLNQVATSKAFRRKIL